MSRRSEPLTLQLLPQRLAICRLPAGAPIPQWTGTSAFCSVTSTPDELSIVVDETCVPGEANCYRGYSAMRISGTLPPGLVGILAALLEPLAEAGIPVFAISTYDTDYVLVRETDLNRTVSVLRSAGHRIT